MPVVTCTKCGGVTNTAVCRHIVDGKIVPPVECYARIKDMRWEKGCGYDNALPHIRQAVDELIADQPQQH